MEEYAAMRSETSPDHSLYSCNAGTDSSSTITRKGVKLDTNIEERSCEHWGMR
jgi:hypothetical protein